MNRFCRWRGQPSPFLLQRNSESLPNADKSEWPSPVFEAEQQDCTYTAFSVMEHLPLLIRRTSLTAWHHSTYIAHHSSGVNAFTLTYRSCDRGCSATIPVLATASESADINTETTRSAKNSSLTSST